MEVLYRVYVGGDLRRDRRSAVLAGADRRGAGHRRARSTRSRARAGAARDRDRGLRARRAARRRSRRPAGDRGGRGPVRAAGAGRPRRARCARRPGVSCGSRALAGAVLGAVVGNFVFRRLPGSPVEWIACLALFGALLPVCVLGAALLACGRRLRPRSAAAIGLLLLAWSAADLAARLDHLAGDDARRPGDAAAAERGDRSAWRRSASRLPLAAGRRSALLGVGGILLEAARRRAALTAELRFSASVQDLRAVVLLRRQLASERPRRRPWLRLRARRRGAIRSGDAAGRASCAGRRPASPGRSSSASLPAPSRSAPGAPPRLRSCCRACCCSSPRSTWSSRWPRSPTTRPGAGCCRCAGFADSPPARRAGGSDRDRPPHRHRDGDAPRRWLDGARGRARHVRAGGTRTCLLCRIQRDQRPLRVPAGAPDRLRGHGGARGRRLAVGRRAGARSPARPSATAARRYRPPLGVAVIVALVAVAAVSFLGRRFAGRERRAA